MASSLYQHMLFPVFFVVGVLCSLAAPSVAELPKFKHPAEAHQYLNFLVVRDWGRKGAYNQSLVAQQKLNIDFVISTGDNFLEDGLKGVDDPAFFESFVDIYTAPSLQKTWYSVLGNHDYRGDVQAQISLVLRQKVNRWGYKSIQCMFKIVEFFFVDTTPFVDEYFTDPRDHTYDWEGVLPRPAYLSKLLKAKWKMVVGHHTIKSARYHGNTEELKQLLVPILEITKSNADIIFYDVFGNALHRWSISKDRNVAAWI
ncbi:Purple acid phosphatase 3 [Spatholobus suberectus]|nr:Purple acid phosphatase 3 [Spatholobus suberectus]